MKTFILSIIVTMITSVAGAQQKSFYDFTVKAIDGKDLPLSTFKGKKVLVVNVASTIVLVFGFSVVITGIVKESANLDNIVQIIITNKKATKDFNAFFCRVSFPFLTYYNV